MSSNTSSSSPSSPNQAVNISNSILKELISVLFQLQQQNRLNAGSSPFTTTSYFFFIASSSLSLANTHSVNQTIAEHILHDKIAPSASSSANTPTPQQQQQNPRVKILEFTKRSLNSATPTSSSSSIAVSIAVIPPSLDFHQNNQYKQQNNNNASSPAPPVVAAEAKSVILALLLTLQKFNPSKSITVVHCLDSPFTPSCADVTMKFANVLYSICKCSSISSSSSTTSKNGFSELQEAVLVTPTSKTVLGVENIADSTFLQESTVIEMDEDDDNEYGDDAAENEHQHQTLQQQYRKPDHRSRISLSSDEGTAIQYASSSMTSTSSISWSISNELENLCIQLLPIPSLGSSLQIIESDASRRYSMTMVKIVIVGGGDEGSEKSNNVAKSGSPSSSSLTSTNFSQIEMMMKNDLIELMTSKIHSVVAKFELEQLQQNSGEDAADDEGGGSDLSSFNVNNRSELTTRVFKMIEESMLELAHVHLSKKFASFSSLGFSVADEHASDEDDQRRKRKQHEQTQLEQQLKKVFETLRSTSSREGSFLRSAVLESRSTKELVQNVVKRIVGNNLLNQLTELIEDLQVVAAV